MERELGDQKWLFQQFLQSPSWRLTYPIRWLAKQIRRVLAILGRRKNSEPSFSSVPKYGVEIEELQEEVDSAFDLKESLTQLYRMQLQSFLASKASLQLPHNDNPEISVILVLFNRAALTFACLRALPENYPERMQIIVVDNAPRDDTPLLL